MKKFISIAVLVGTVFPFISGPKVLGEETVSIHSESESENQIMVVTANRIEQNINDTLASVEVLSREDIEKIQPESITDLLSTVAGFDFVYTGGDGQSSSLFTRGTSSDHTLVLIDGIRVGSASLGNKDFSTIPVAQIERIEIVKGPRASLWGSDAIGGVIQIFTRKLENEEYSFDVMTGANNFISSNVSVGFGNADVNNTFTVSYENSDGFDAFDNSSDFGPDSEPDADGYQRTSIALRGEYQISDRSVMDWVLQADEGDNEFDNAYGANVNEYNNRLLNLRYTYISDHWLTEVSVKQSRDETFSFDARAIDLDDGLIDTKQGSTYVTKREQINLLTQYELNEDVNLLAGIERYTDDLADSEILLYEGGTAPFDETQRTSKSAFVSSIINAGQLISELSFRYDDVGTAGSENTFNFSAGYQITTGITLSVSRAKGFKAPTFNDLYFPGFSNPDLNSEISFNSEIMLKGQWNKQSLTIIKFDNKVDQLITFFFDPDTFVFAPFNIDKANLKGHEIVYQVRSGNLAHKFTASYVDAIDQSIDSFTLEAKNEQLLRRAKEHYGYELTADVGDYSLFAQANYSGSRRDNDFSTFPATAVILKSHTVLNMGVSYQASERMSVKLKVADMTNSEESTVVNYNTVGRQIFLSFQYRNF